MKQEHKDWTVIGTALIVLIIFLQTCGVKSSIRDVEDRMIYQIDSLSKVYEESHSKIQDKVISEEEMIELIETTPAWKTLRIEEISDKERISINALEEKDK